MALAPWNVLAGGKIRTDAEEQARRQSGEKGRIMLDPNWERNDQERKVCQALEKVAAEVGAKHITSGEAFEFHFSVIKANYSLYFECIVAIAYLLQKTPYVFPIVGGRKVEHLLANIEALDIDLTDEHIKTLESAGTYDPGFPGWLIVRSLFHMQRPVQ